MAFILTNIFIDGYGAPVIHLCKSFPTYKEATEAFISTMKERADDDEMDGLKFTEKSLNKHLDNCNVEMDDEKFSLSWGDDQDIWTIAEIGFDLAEEE